MTNQLKYTIFKVKWGFFGLLVSKNALLRTSLPVQTSQSAKKYLLVGIKNAPTFSQKLYPRLQELITDYYYGRYVKFNDIETGLILLTGSDFRKKILKTCGTIKSGQTISYGQLAKRAGFGRAARAAGSVLAQNPLPLIIPCHRVIRNDGKIGRFSTFGGIKMKKKMLELEQTQKSKG